MPAVRSVSKICKCRSHCTTLNPATGLYEGEGQLHTQGTRYNHARDDKLLKAREKIKKFLLPRKVRSTARSQLEASTSAHAADDDDHRHPQANWLKRIHDEFAAYCEVPVTSPTVPLVFNHHPAHNGEYIRPSKDQLLLPNFGLYSLLEKRCHTNAPFIATENRLCELASLSKEGTSDEASTLYNAILEELARLNWQKEHHWEQQRGGSSHKVVVNTGKADFTLLSL